MSQTPAEARREAAAAAIRDFLDFHGVELSEQAHQDLADEVLAVIHPLAEHCTHYVTAHRQHHDPPVAGCPWCATPPAPNTVPTGDFL